ncbi:hypothetical protein BB559_002928 [Furculomyces boomerangus]|uniref:Mediator of RNA polymerase II transcription subunit 18 n=2 Tax=Harpellales TaxID=61421 RepID=A0A2T9YR40_9FUNG|nr:hypothetical protein BB559_002928 [Furculomyces boomerangus]PWA01214.1 hypothetical protein BB558_002708 [Smittium angustum]
MLKDRLDAVCGGIESGRKRMELYEIFQPKFQTPIGPTRKDDVLLFLRTQYGMSNPSTPLLERISILQYGQPETHSKRRATIRPLSSSTIHYGNAYEILDHLGYKKFASNVRNGFWYHFENMAWIGFYQIHKNDDTGIIGGGGLLDPSGTWIIEVTAQATGQENVAQAIDVLERIRSLIRGTAELYVLDHVYTQSKVVYV